MTGNQAGHSAQEQARLRREKIQRLERSAAAWEAGAVGEQATGQVLERLDPALWVTWHDVRWPGRKWANIDHVVVGPPGVFVIDSKNWSGAVELKNGVLRQNGYSREKAVAGAAEAGIAVLELVPDVPIHPVLCLVREESFTGWVRDVMLCSTNNLDVMVQTRPHLLTPEQVRATAGRLEAGLSSGRRPVQRPAPQPLSAFPASRRPSVHDTSRCRRAKGRSGAVSLARRLAVGLTAAALLATLGPPALFWIGEQVGEVVVEPTQPRQTDDKPKRDATKKERLAKQRAKRAQ